MFQGWSATEACGSMARSKYGGRILFGSLRVLPMFIGLSMLWCGLAVALSPEEVAVFEPAARVLATRCVVCHGVGEQKAGLRLDNAADAFAVRDSGQAIIPGDDGGSLLLTKIRMEDEGKRMPPAGNPPLSAEEATALTEWIKSGAPWPEGHTIQLQSDHWSFQQPVRPEVPTPQQSEWIRNPIDAFVLQRLEASGVLPSPEADKATLMRRLYLDITGLPPTPEEVDAYVNDSSPHAYKALVNRLLASPHFGERWGRHWLDLARYADSNGYEKDNARPYAYRYRDYVIDALNRDVPYDQFAIEQLAGDLLPNPSQMQLIATGFHRNTLTNTEGGIDPEEDRVKQAKDRTNTTASVFLGLTMACAECHTHKYDPLTQREYYGMYSFFNHAQEKNIAAPTQGETLAYRQALARYNSERARLKATIDKERPQVAERLPAWEASLELPEKGWMALDPLSYASSGGSEFQELDDKSLLLEGAEAAMDTYTIVARSDEQGIRAIRLEALTDERLTKNGPGRAHNGNFVLGEFRVFASPVDNPHQREQLTLVEPTADFEQKGLEVGKAIDGDPNTGWAIYRERDMNQPRTAIFSLAEPIENADGILLTFELAHHYGRAHNIGRLRLSLATEDPATLGVYSDDILAALKTPAADRTEEQVNAVIAFYSEYDPELQKHIAALRGLDAAKPQPPSTQAQTMIQSQEPPTTYLHVRGDFLTKGDEIETHVPAVMPALIPRRNEPDRLDLAEWIVSPANPLTARVQVNRMWMYLFGDGLVRTPGDFGVRGDLPTHPELLDWLATEFVAQGWSVKDMIRLIVESATYRQTSDVRPDVWEHDPENKLIARQSRFRVTAEITRDMYLAASGLLDRTIGGPSIRPPLPSGVASLGYANSVKWVESTGSEKYRRGIYIFFQRTVPYPMLMTFDCPDSNVANTERTRSNTPLQALTLLNNNAFFETAQALGGRVLAEGLETDAERATRMFRLCLGRVPSDEEVTRLTAFMGEQRSTFAAAEETATEFAAQHQPSGADPVEAAVNTALARVIMNLDEFVTRE